ncbi:MAG: 30S ribosomal protein S13 [Candidatus Eisenbacteria bacterium]|uniref:Small ribosomal subunit protein uS13 n=1 Tax=Eiseniibacteriota bacterium TaxID=2212470 RepID=A0A538TRU7_UNCEI|nr:MAG: 30S ribosomal protein S13 [Candidatus Eisenbacteria bacterium]
MARIAGVDLPNDKRIVIGLTYIFGIGPSSARKIIHLTGVNANTRVKALAEEEVTKLRQVIESQFKVEGARRSEVAMSIKRLMDIGAYRGLRHRKNLPARGQRTRTNARTRKGPKKTAGAVRKVAVAAKRPAPKPAG